MPSTLVADTSVVYAALDPTDADHEPCFALLASGVSVVIPATVIVEVDWLARSRGANRLIDLLLESVIDGSVVVADLDREDLERVRQLVAHYEDLPLDVVDASVVAVAERLEQETVATLDRRHFSAVRPAHAPAFTLVP